MNIDVVERSGSLILTVDGDLDIATAPLLAEQLARAEASDAVTVVVDLDRVGFMDSTALHVLVEHVGASRRDGQRLRLTKGSEQVRRLFEITGAIDQLPFEADSEPTDRADRETPQSPSGRSAPTVKQQPQPGSPRLNNWRDTDTPGRGPTL